MSLPLIQVQGILDRDPRMLVSSVAIDQRRPTGTIDSEISVRVAAGVIVRIGRTILARVRHRDAKQLLRVC